MNQASRLTRARALEIASLDRTPTRRKLGQFRIEGMRSVESAVAADVVLLEVVVKRELLDDPRLDFVRGGRYEIRSVDSKTASKLSSVVQDQGIVAVGRIPEPDPDWMRRASKIVVLDGVQDPGNVGTIVRCAAWFGFGAVAAGPGTADFFNPKTVRSMAGSMWDVDLVPSDNLKTVLRQLSESGFQLVGADLDGERLSAWDPPQKVALVLGSEAHGLSSEAAGLVDKLIRIEGGSAADVGVESLNVAVAAGIIMHRIGG